MSSNVKSDAVTCKDWTTNEMIKCVDGIIGKATSAYDCQLPMSIKIGKPLCNIKKKHFFNFFIIALHTHLTN